MVEMQNSQNTFLEYIDRLQLRKMTVDGIKLCTLDQLEEKGIGT